MANIKIDDVIYKNIDSIDIPNADSDNYERFIEYESLLDRTITSLTIPENVTKIDNYLCQNCSNLESVDFPNTLVTLGNYAFQNCSNLTSITLPNNVASIGYEAFYNCNSLTSITIPNSVTSIGQGAFEGCSNLTSITIPESVTSIGGSAFSGCTGLTEINYNAVDASGRNFTNLFYNAGNSSDGIIVNIGEIVTIIPANFLYISNVTYKPKVLQVNFAEESECTSIGDYAFSGCSELTSIVIPNTVTDIGREAFSKCSSLTNITIPAGEYGFIRIGATAFKGCTSLTSVTIKGNVSFSGDPFNGDTNISKYDFSSVTEIPSLPRSNFLPHANGCIIVIPDDLYDMWITKPVWSEITDVVYTKASEV